jgi:hypothetical protein
MSLIQSTALALPAKSQLGAANPTGLPGGIAGELIASELMPRYSTLTKLGKVFTARGALQTLSVAGTAMTGLVLWNPAGSGVDMHVLKVAGDVAVTSATMTGIALAYITNQPTTPTTVTAASAQSCDYVSGALGSVKAYSVATLVAAPVAQFDVMHNTAAIAVTGEDTGFLLDLEGSIVVPAGNGICFVALGAASAASAVNLSAKYAELPA